LPAPFKLGIWSVAPPTNRTPAYEGTGATSFQAKASS
jgi:hypothetical protein